MLLVAHKKNLEIKCIYKSVFWTQTCDAACSHARNKATAELQDSGLWFGRPCEPSHAPLCSGLVLGWPILKDLLHFQEPALKYDQEPSATICSAELSHTSILEPKPPFLLHRTWVRSRGTLSPCPGLQSNGWLRKVLPEGCGKAASWAPAPPVLLGAWLCSCISWPALLGSSGPPQFLQTFFWSSPADLCLH